MSIVTTSVSSSATDQASLPIVQVTPLGSVTPAIEWSVHPARLRPIAAVFAFIAVIAVASLVAQLAGDWLWGALSTIGLLISLSRFFMPTHYRIDADAAEVIYPLSKSRLRWHEVQYARWKNNRAIFARSPSRRGRASALAFDFTTLSAHEIAQLHAQARAHTSPQAWQ